MKRLTGRKGGYAYLIGCISKETGEEIGKESMFMARLYKLTLYVCDLEDNLSLGEIKDAIRQDALDGISTSCVTHFSNEKIGPEIDWDDNIDLNRVDSTTEQWERYFQSEQDEVPEHRRLEFG